MALDLLDQRTFPLVLAGGTAASLAVIVTGQLILRERISTETKRALVLAAGMGLTTASWAGEGSPAPHWDVMAWTGRTLLVAALAHQVWSRWSVRRSRARPTA